MNKRLISVLFAVAVPFLLFVPSGCSPDSTIETVNPFQHETHITVEFNTADTADIYRVTVVAQVMDTVDSFLSDIDTLKYYEPAAGNSMDIAIPEYNPSAVTIDLIRNSTLISTGSFNVAAGVSDTVIKLGVQTVPPPAIPSGLSASSNVSSVSLSWNAVDGADLYFIYRTTDTSAGSEFLKKSWRTSSTDGSVSSGNTYYYQVSAVSEAGESTHSEWIAVEITGH
jgi:hypothetical protein